MYPAKRCDRVGVEDISMKREKGSVNKGREGKGCMFVYYTDTARGYGTSEPRTIQAR